MFALLRKAYRDVTKRRVRSLFTLAGIVVGVAGIVAIVSTGQNLARAQASAYADASQSDISFWVWDALASTERAVAGLNNVTAAELRVDFFTRCRWALDGAGESQTARDVSFHGVEDLATARVDQVFLKSGRWPREGEFVAEQSVLGAAPLHLGDTVTCRAQAGNPDRTLVLVGLVQSPSYPSASILDYLTFFAPSLDVKRLLGTAGSNSLLLKVNNLSRARETADEVVQLLDRRTISHGDATIRDPQNYLGKRELDALLTLLFAFSAVGLATSGFLVANTLAAIVAEQVGEIGTIKALGGTRPQVLTIYFASALLYGIGGTALGLLLGTVLSWRLLAYIGSLLSLTTGFEIAPLALALGAVVGLGVTLVGGALPSIAATSIPVKEALESYGITSTYGTGRVDRLILGLVALPPLAAMSLRNLARRKGRTIVTVFVIAVAVSVSLAAQSVSVSVDAAIDNLFKTYRADAWVWFGENVSTAFESSLRSLPYVVSAETWSLEDAWVTVTRSNRGSPTGMSGFRPLDPVPDREIAARARLWGLPAKTTLYQPNLVQGRWYQEGETDAAVISSDLAQALKLRVGDYTEVDTGGDTRWFRIVGIAVDNSVFLGSQVEGKVFLSEDIVAQMDHRSGYATFFAVSLDRHDAVGVQGRLDQIAARFNQYQVGSDSAAREVRGAKEQTRILTIALAAMSLLVGLIGALGVLNTLTLNVVERRREVGVLRVLGGSDASLIQAFLTEGLAFGLGGWGVGIALGYPLGAILTHIMESVLFHIDYIFDARMVLISLVFALVLAGAASLVPALAAARLKVGQVLRYE
jgi:putative ABC transport system permease protein